MYPEIFANDSQNLYCVKALVCAENFKVDPDYVIDAEVLKIIML